MKEKYNLIFLIWIYLLCIIINLFLLPINLGVYLIIQAMSLLSFLFPTLVPPAATKYLKRKRQDILKRINKV